MRHGKASGCGAATLTNARTGEGAYASGGPGGHAAPVVADDHAAGESQALDHTGDIERGGLRVVSAWGFVARAVAAQVHGSHTEPGLVECR